MMTTGKSVVNYENSEFRTIHLQTQERPRVSTPKLVDSVSVRKRTEPRISEHWGPTFWPHGIHNLIFPPIIV